MAVCLPRTIGTRLLSEVWHFSNDADPFRYPVGHLLMICVQLRFPVSCKLNRKRLCFAFSVLIHSPEYNSCWNHQRKKENRRLSFLGVSFIVPKDTRSGSMLIGTVNRSQWPSSQVFQDQQRKMTNKPERNSVLIRQDTTVEIISVRTKPEAVLQSKQQRRKAKLTIVSGTRTN